MTADELSPLARKLRRALRESHVGITNAVKGQALADVCEAEKRDVQEAVRELVLADEPVGSLSSVGYWWCESAEEALPVYAELVGRIENQVARAKAWRRRFPKLKELDQLALEFTEVN